MRGLRSGWMVLLLLLFAGGGAAEDQAPAPKVRLLFFWAVSCPHCAEQEPFLQTLQQRHPYLEVSDYEVWNQPQNFELLEKLAATYGRGALGTPATLVGDRLWFGFSEGIGAQIEAEVVRCRVEGCRDPLARLGQPPMDGGGAAATGPVTLPLFGSLDPQRTPLLLLTLVLGLLDSFNPCAFFVLFFLLSLLVHARSRRRMLLVGGTFVLCSGLIYFLFMAAWLGIFLVGGRWRAVTVAAGIVAVVVAVINIKDFFLFQRGVTLSIPEGAKPRLFERMRRLVKASRTPSVLFGTLVLALAANSYELLCTAGFPMVYTRALTLHRLETWQYYAFLALYNLVYILPLAVIVLVFTVTLGTRKLSEWQGRVLKLISGLMMLFLGLVLLVKPALLNSLWTAIGLLALALGTGGVMLGRERMKG